VGGKLWGEVIDRLNADRIRAAVLDYRGFGKSDRAANSYRWENFSDDVLAVADEIGAKQFIPVGFSFGGKLACFLAAKFPDRITAQVLVAPVAPGTVALERETGVQLCHDTRDWKRVRPILRGLWFGPSVNEELLDVCCQATAEVPLDVLLATVEMGLWTSLEDALGKMSTPTLVIAGSDDPSYGVPYQREKMLPFLSRSELTSVPAGHFVPREKPGQVAAMIDVFVARQK